METNASCSVQKFCLVSIIRYHLKHLILMSFIKRLFLVHFDSITIFIKKKVLLKELYFYLLILILEIKNINVFSILFFFISRKLKLRLKHKKYCGGCPRGVMVKAMDYGIIVSEFVLQSCYYIHFRANTLGKCMNPFILSAMG